MVSDGKAGGKGVEGAKGEALGHHQRRRVVQ